MTMKSIVNALFLVSLLALLCIGCGNATIFEKESMPEPAESFGEAIELVDAMEREAVPSSEMPVIEPPVAVEIEAVVETDSEAQPESNAAKELESDNGICMLYEEDGTTLWRITKITLETFLRSYETYYPEWSSGVLNGKYYHIAEGNGYMYMLEDCGAGTSPESQTLIESFISQHELTANPICVSPHYTAPGAVEEIARREQQQDTQGTDSVRERVCGAENHECLTEHMINGFVDYIMVDPDFLENYGGENWTWRIESGELQSTLLCCTAPGEDPGMQHVNVLIYNSSSVFQGPCGYLSEGFLEEMQIANYVSALDIPGRPDVPNGVEIEGESIGEESSAESIEE